MYVSRICLITKNLRIDIHWIFSLENLTGSSNEKQDTTNLITKKLRIEIKWNDYVLIRLSMGATMKCSFFFKKIPNN